MAYKVIHETFWTDPRVKRLPFKLKAFFSFLITGPSAHYSGLYYLPKAYISEHTGLSKKEVAISLKTLVDAGFIQYDEATECIWVVNMLRHQMKAWGGNRRKTEIGIQKHLALLHNSILIPLFIERYSILNLTLPLTLPEPSAKVPYTDTVTVNNISLEGGMGGGKRSLNFGRFILEKKVRQTRLKHGRNLGSIMAFFKQYTNRFNYKERRLNGRRTGANIFPMRALGSTEGDGKMNYQLTKMTH